MNMATESISYQNSPLQLVAFNDVEDELFGAPGTPDHNEYEARVALELLPQSVHEKDETLAGGTVRVSKKQVE